MLIGVLPSHEEGLEGPVFDGPGAIFRVSSNGLMTAAVTVVVLVAGSWVLAAAAPNERLWSSIWKRRNFLPSWPAARIHLHDS